MLIFAGLLVVGYSLCGAAKGGTQGRTGGAIVDRWILVALTGLAMFVLGISAPA